MFDHHCIHTCELSCCHPVHAASCIDFVHTITYLAVSSGPICNGQLTPTHNPCLALCDVERWCVIFTPCQTKRQTCSIAGHPFPGRASQPPAVQIDSSVQYTLNTPKIASHSAHRQCRLTSYMAHTQSHCNCWCNTKVHHNCALSTVTRSLYVRTRVICKSVVQLICNLRKPADHAHGPGGGGGGLQQSSYDALASKSAGKRKALSNGTHSSPQRAIST